MPYSKSQCAKFAMMAAGKAPGNPPSDWKEHCTKAEQAKAKKRRVKKKVARKR